jgi:tRNA (guanine37-N1)-methyltransferase
VHYRIFSLHPEIFGSFLSESLVARGLSKDVISVELCNWREKFGIGSYKQVDDRPYGGGSGMVLMPDPIFNALTHFEAISTLYSASKNITQHHKVLPNNSRFYNLTEKKTKPGKATIMLTPRGFSLNQKTVEWLSGFDELNILCGRYEGFDARVSECVDLEISLGDYILNGGEIGAMAIVESVSRMIPGFITKPGSVNHDSFSSELNVYNEMREYVYGKRQIKKRQIEEIEKNKTNLFDDQLWLENKLIQVEHPQYTRPNIWSCWQVPEILLSGDHKKLQYWRENWYKFDKSGNF